MQVCASGMCCSLGWQTPAVVAALRAHLNHFQHSQFVGKDGKPLVAAAMHDLNIWGPERLSLMLKSSLAACLEAAQLDAGFDAARTALLLMLPEPDRAAYPFEALEALSVELVQEFGLHAHIGVGKVGKGGFADALAESHRLLNARTDTPIDAVVLAAVDTFLDAPTIERLLAQGRVANSGNTDALLPGEGACAVVLSRRRVDATRSTLQVDGWAQGQDRWHVGGDAPLRAETLTEVFREAAAAAG
jgi:3-oxoacyl-[acyl-carrier-protein] synthase-1